MGCCGAGGSYSVFTDPRKAKEARGVVWLKACLRDFLVLQWLRTGLPMQGTQVRSLVGELRFYMCRRKLSA